jgi:hypothetical protein
MVRSLATLTLTVLIMLLAVLSTSMVFVAVAGLATIWVYATTARLEASLAAGLIAGITGWIGFSLVPDLFAGLQDRPSADHGQRKARLELLRLTSTHSSGE